MLILQIHTFSPPELCRLTFIPFVLGPCSPNGLEQQQQAEVTWKERYEKAPMALGPLLAINVAEVIEEGKCLKHKIAGLYPDVDDRICENCGILVAIASKVNVSNQVIKHNEFVYWLLD